MDDWDMGYLEIVKIGNLARLFYKMQGYDVEEGYDFRSATHPQEKQCWEQAKIAYVVLVCDGEIPTSEPDEEDEGEG